MCTNLFFQIFLRVDGGSKVLREGVWEEKPGKSANRPPSLPLHHSRASRDCSRELRQNPRSSIAWAVQAFGIIRYSFVKFLYRCWYLVIYRRQ